MKKGVRFNCNRLRTCLLALFLIVFAAGAYAQKQPKKTTYIMPDGSILPAEKLDSLSNAWGIGRIMFQHSTADDEKGIMHIVRVTDEMAKKQAEEEAKRQQAMNAMIGTNAPDFTLKDINGRSWQLSALKGKVVVLNFWFTSCPPCIDEMPQLNSLVKKYATGEVVFLGLTFNDAKNVTAFLKEHAFEYTILVESDEVNAKFGISAWPANMVIDRKGIITSILDSGPSIDSDLSKAIDAVL